MSLVMRNSVRRLLTIFTVVLLVLSLSEQSRAEERGQVARRLLQAELEVLQKRIEILKKANERAQKLRGTDAGAGNGAALNRLIKNYDRDMGDLLNRRRKLEQLLAETEAKNLSNNQALGALSALKGSCALHGCLQILGIMNQDLARSIADATTEVVIQNWETFELRSQQARARAAADEDSLNEVSKLCLKSWACERSLAKVAAPVALDSQKLGQCFASVLVEAAKESGKQPTLSNGLSFSLPMDDNLSEYGDKHRRITKRVAASPDYQAKPWEIFKECAAETGGALRESFDLCYEVLRYNRARPDFKRKLLDIRGDRSEGGDNSGDWYHLFGMAKMATWFGTTAAQLNRFVLPVIEGKRELDELEVRNDTIGAEASDAAEKALKAFLDSGRPLPSSAQACKVEAILLRQPTK